LFVCGATVDFTVAADAEEQLCYFDGQLMTNVAELIAGLVDLVWVVAGGAFGSVLFKVI